MRKVIGILFKFVQDLLFQQVWFLGFLSLIATLAPILRTFRLSPD